MKNTLLTIRTHLQSNAIEMIKTVSDYKLEYSDRDSQNYKSLLLGEAWSILVFEYYDSLIPKKWINNE